MTIKQIIARTFAESIINVYICRVRVYYIKGMPDPTLNGQDKEAT